jgi:hypothetical protein
MILHRSPRGVISSDYREVVLRARPAMRGQRVSKEAFQSGAVDDAILAAFDLVTLVEALARDLNDQRGSAIPRPPAKPPPGQEAFAASPRPCCAAVAKKLPKEGLETLIAKASKDRGASVARCTTCDAGWVIETPHAARRFDPLVAFDAGEVDRVVAGIRAGHEVVVGGSRCHTTYRGKGGAFVAEDFDDGQSHEKPCAESTLRYVIAHDPESFLAVLRKPLHERLSEVLLEHAEGRATREDVHACLGELLAFGECLTHADLLEAVIAWPEEKPAPDALARLLEGRTGLDVYHAIMSAIGYGTKSAAAGRFGLRFFSTVAEMGRGGEKLPDFQRYRSDFEAMANANDDEKVRARP